MSAGQHPPGPETAGTTEDAGSPPHPRDGERGVALVIVLWVIVALTIQVGVFTVQVRDGARLVETAAAIARGETLVHAAVEVAASRVAARRQQDRWLADGSDRTLTIAGTEVMVSVHDENGRININLAQPALIEGLLRVLTRSPGEARTLADRIADWRDPDNERRRQGAEDRDYRRAALEHGAGDAPFLDAADLGRVLGMPAELAERLQPHVTVYTADGRINPQLASETVLRSLPGVTAEAVEQALELIRRGGREALAIEDVLSAARNHIGGRRGPAFRVKVRILGDRRNAMGAGEAIVVVGVDGGKPYRTLAWRFRPG